MKFSRIKIIDEKWDHLCSNCEYLSGDVVETGLYEDINSVVINFQGSNVGKSNVIAYLAVAPNFFGPITKGLAGYPFIKKRDHTRFVFEKPFGHDLASALEPVSYTHLTLPTSDLV